MQNNFFPSNFAIKTNAKASLKNNWFSAFAITLLILFAVLFVVYFTAMLTSFFRIDNLDLSGGEIKFSKDLVCLLLINLFSLVLELFLIVPLLFGSIKWFWKLSLGTVAPISEVFYYYSTIANFKKVVFVSISLFFRAFVILIICLSPSILTYILSNSVFLGVFGSIPTTFTESFKPLANMLSVLGYIAFYIGIFRYILVPAVLIKYPNLSVNKTIKYATKLSFGYRSKAFVLLLSFLGWFVLCLAGIPIFFVVPYFLTSYCFLSRYAIFHSEENIKRKEKMAEQNTANFTY